MSQQTPDPDQSGKRAFCRRSRGKGAFVRLPVRAGATAEMVGVATNDAPVSAAGASNCNKQTVIDGRCAPSREGWSKTPRRPRAGSDSARLSFRPTGSTSGRTLQIEMSTTLRLFRIPFDEMKLQLLLAVTANPLGNAQRQESTQFWGCCEWSFWHSIIREA